jgi:hypothetical protein
MRLIDDFRYLDDRLKRRVVAPGALVLATLIAGVVLLVSHCHQRTDIATARVPPDETRAISQVRDAMFSVTSRLVGEDPAKSVEDAVQRAAGEKADGVGPSVVDRSSLKFNPNIAAWRDARGRIAAGTALVVGPAPASFQKRKVMLIGVGRGGVPLEITAETMPDWVGNPVMGPRN